MSIVATEIESIHGAVGQQRFVFYVCTDHLGGRHPYGPVIVSKSDAFDIEGFKTIAATKVTESLAASEFNRLIG